MSVRLTALASALLSMVIVGCSQAPASQEQVNADVKAEIQTQSQPAEIAENEAIQR
ncbi:MAG: hypothetical protein KF824_00395 [Fimbriimonadaceae bacterium]|nr:MAG: hypothetical protein KF824_00395 [Fimbriimonadaceae bacterium]